MPSASGAFSDRGGYSLVMTLTLISQNVAGNFSVVATTLDIIENVENGTWDNSGMSWALDMGGYRASGVATYDFRAYNALNLWNGWIYVDHNPDGTKGVTYTAACGGGTTLGSAGLTAWYALPTIPRASTVTFASGTPAEPDIGTTITLNTNRAASSFTHNITYLFGTQSGTIANNVGTSTTWTIPMSLLNMIPNATRGNGTITTRTYSGGNLIGTTTTNFIVRAPTNIIPNWSSVSVTQATTNVTGAWVQGISKAKFAINGAAGVYGSTITVRKFEVAGQTLSGASGTTSNPISSSGTVPAKFTITDTRGRSKTQTTNLTVLAYTAPVISSFKVTRALSNGTPDPDDGTFLRVTINAAAKSLVVGGVQKNSIAFKVYTKLKTASTWTLSRQYTPGGTSYNGGMTITGPFAVDKAYDVRVDVIDVFKTSSAQSVVAVAPIFMHWGNGLGVGKYHEVGGLDVKGDIYSNGSRVFTTANRNGLASATPSVTNIDTTYDTGWYATSSATTGGTLPPGGTFWVVEVVNAGNRSIQTAEPWTGNGTPKYRRYRNPAGEATWTPWTLVESVNTGWITATKTSGWANYAGEVVRFKVNNGYCSLAGRTTGSTSAGTTIFTLPENARHDFPHAMVWNTHSDDGPTIIVVGNDGAVTIASRVGLNRQGVSLAGVTFPVAS